MLQDWLRYSRGPGRQGCRPSQGTVLLTENQIIKTEWNIIILSTKICLTSRKHNKKKNALHYNAEQNSSSVFMSILFSKLK